ncbi:hypothetical protein PFISCL1PPCAC_5119, partial [Pristionchus fissidentatus]
LANTIQSVGARGKGSIQETRKDMRNWIDFPNQLNDAMSQMQELIRSIEFPLKATLLKVVAIVVGLIVRSILEIILDAIDVFVFCHRQEEEDVLIPMATEVSKKK